MEKKILSEELRFLDYPFSVRTINCFNANDIKTVKDLTKQTDEDLLKFRNLGYKTLIQIRDFLDLHGLKLNNLKRCKCCNQLIKQL